MEMTTSQFSVGVFLVWLLLFFRIIICSISSLNTYLNCYFQSEQHSFTLQLIRFEHILAVLFAQNTLSVVEQQPLLELRNLQYRKQKSIF